MMTKAEGRRLAKKYGRIYDKMHAEGAPKPAVGFWMIYQLLDFVDEAGAERGTVVAFLESVAQACEEGEESEGYGPAADELYRVVDGRKKVIKDQYVPW